MKFKKALPVILSVASCVGVFLTGYFSAKGKEKQMREVIYEGDIKVKSFVRNYWPAMASGASTIACIASNGILSMKQQACLVAACTALEKGYRGYKEKVNAVVTEEQKKAIEHATKTKFTSIDDGFDELASKMEPCLFYFDFGSDQEDNYFETTPIDVIAAEAEFNARFADTGNVSMNDLRECYGLDWKPKYDVFGYNMECGYFRVRFTHKKTYLCEDGLYAYVITPDVEPSENYENPNHIFVND